ncbi:MAG TPA: N-acetylmuramoyl-L-alanine amidase [Elusimicrobiales bacterium]|nr:N-acetylmuramoyl-L-alanine amidase [Elusimicrobiales bacterium]
MTTKKIFLCASLASLFFAGSLSAEYVKISIEGKNKGAVESVKYKDVLYLNAKRAVRIFRGSLYWQARSGKVVLSVKRYRAVFTIGSINYSSNGKKRHFEEKIIKHKNKVFLPLKFFLSEDFAAAVGKNVYFDDLDSVLEIGKRYNVGEAEHFIYGDLTRVSLEMRGKKKYSYHQKSKRNVAILIPDAVASSAKRVNFKEGMIKSIWIRQMPSDVLVNVLFSGKVKSWDVELEDGNLIVEASGKPQIPKIVKSPSKSKVSKTSLADTDDETVLDISEESSLEAESQQVGKDGDIILDFSSAQGETVVSDDKKPSGKVSASIISSKLNIPDAVGVNKSGKRVIVIDAGHGGKDSGGIARRKVVEKNINLLVAKALAEYFKKHKNLKVILTRASDMFIPLHKRSKIANDAKADIFISIHANAHRISKQNGFEVFVLSKNASDPWAAEVAEFENSVAEMEKDKLVTSADVLLHSMAKNEHINDSLALGGLITKRVTKDVSLKNRGVKKGDFYVLRGTYMPSILIETGFVTNKRDRKILSSSSYRKKISNAIYKAILTYAKAKNWKL